MLAKKFTKTIRSNTAMVVLRKHTHFASEPLKSSDDNDAFTRLDVLHLMNIAELAFHTQTFHLTLRTTSLHCILDSNPQES